jgi:alpha-galactosidase
MSTALAATGRPMVFSICEWGISHPWDWAPAVGNLWRTAGDIADCFKCTGRRPEGGPRNVGGDDDKGPPPPFMGMMGLGVLQELDLQAGLGFAAGPGHWNDPDMLEVGNGGMSEGEDRAQFSLWAMLAAPLIAGNDLAHMSDATKAILTNREVIAVDQDPAGIEATRVAHSGDADVWVRVLADGGRAVALLNRSESARQISVSWPELGFGNSAGLVRDLWRGKDVGKFSGSYQATVAAHAVMMLRIGKVH